VVGHRVVVQVDTVAIGVLDGAPVEGQRVGGDADAVVVAIRHLHVVSEPHRLPARRVEIGSASFVAHSEHEPRITAHDHWLAEIHADSNLVTRAERVSAERGIDPDSGHGGRRVDAPVHLVLGVIRCRVVAEVGISAVGVLDGASVEAQRVYGNADAVVVAVRGLNDVFEREVPPPSVPREHAPELRVPRIRANRQRHPGPSGNDRFWSIEDGVHRDGTADGMHTARRRVDQVHVRHRKTSV
jgi:hypothetical protein